MKVGARLVLASASPRRRALLEEMGLRFEVVPSEVDESLPSGSEPGGIAEGLALRKARAVAEGLRDALVLGADTLVVAGSRILGKPRDRAEAREFLRLLSGTTHRVITGVALLEAPDGEPGVGHEVTRVTMRSLAGAEIEAYLDSAEWEGKAGAYAIQESGDRFVVRLEGSRSNVVGLPVELVRRLLLAKGWSA